MIDNSPRAGNRIDVEFLGSSSELAALASDVQGSVSFKGSSSEQLDRISLLAAEFGKKAERSVPFDKLRGELIKNAAAFVCARYDALDLKIPSRLVYQGVLQADRPNLNLGQAYAPERSFDLSILPNFEAPYVISLAAHEITHAVGNVSFRPRARGNTPAIVSNGWLLYRHSAGASPESAPFPLYQVFEEAIAHHHERLCFVENGGVLQPLVRQAYLATRVGEYVRLAAIQIALRDSKANESFLRSVLTDPEKEASFAAALQNEQAFGIDLSGERLVYNNKALSTRYNTLPAALADLAKELYPGVPESEERFMRDLAKVQIGGSRTGFLRNLDQTLGPCSSKFFALLNIDDRTPGRQLDSVLLSLYVKAGSVDRGLCLVIRNELTRILVARRKEDSGF